MIRDTICSVSSHHGKCHSRENLNCQVHQDMKLNAGLQTNSNSKTIWMIFMHRTNAQ